MPFTKPPTVVCLQHEYCVDELSIVYAFYSLLYPLNTGTLKNASQARGVDHASAYEDLEMTHTNYTLHYALMTGLEPGQQYFYELGCT